MARLFHILLAAFLAQTAMAGEIPIRQGDYICDYDRSCGIDGTCRAHSRKVWIRATEGEACVEPSSAPNCNPMIRRAYLRFGQSTGLAHFHHVIEDTPENRRKVFDQIEVNVVLGNFWRTHVVTIRSDGHSQYVISGVKKSKSGQAKHTTFDKLRGTCRAVSCRISQDMRTRTCLGWKMNLRSLPAGRHLK